MILFISNSGETLPIAYRVQKEGREVMAYIHSTQYRGNYDGLVDRVSATKLPGKIKKAEAVVFDIIRPNEGTHADQLLLKIFKCSRQVPEVFGAVADKIKKNVPVIGASKETATWELDRKKGTQIAKQVGIAVPETYEFKSLSEGMAFLKGKKDRWVFKPNNNQDLDLTYVESFPGELKSKFEGEYKERLGDSFDYILQKVIEGVEISTEMWFDGHKPVLFNHTIEDKRLMNSNLGPAIGSQSNTVWIKQNPDGLLMAELGKLVPLLQAAGYAGPIDVNTVISETDQKPYFLEWTCRMGYDALYCLLSLLNGKIGDFLTNGFRGNFADEFASSQRITIPPFPYSEPSLLNNYAKGVEIQSGMEDRHFWAEDIKKNGNRIECAGADGILGVVAARGNSLGGSVGNMYRAIDNLKIASTLQYRTDGGRRAERAINKLKKWKISVN